MKILKFTINEKLIAGLVAAFFLILVLLPLFSIARFDHPAADDFGYGFLTHVNWEADHDVPDLFHYAWMTARSNYDTWQGTFSSIYLMSLSPAVFGEQYYVLVPYIMLGSLIISIMYLSKVVFHDLLHSSNASWIIISLTVLLILIEEIYTPGTAFFWYNGAIHYTFMQAAMILLTAFSIKCIAAKSNLKTTVYLVLSLLFCVLVAGGNYVNALIGLILLVCLLATLLTFSKERRKKALLLLLPIALYTFLFLLSARAPGNAIRGANYVGFSAIQSILYSFRSGAVRSIEWFSLFTLTAMLAIVPSVWGVVSKSKFRFRLPILVLTFSFCLFAAMFTSSYYSLGNDGLPRALNNAKMIYQLLLFGNEIYFLGWLSRVLREKKKTRTIPHLALFYLIAAAAFSSIFLCCDNKEAAFPSYAAFKYVRQGFAQAYDNAYNDRLALLQSDASEVYLPEFNIKLNLLYVDDVTTNSSDWGNL